MTKKAALGKGIASLIQATPNQLLEETLKTTQMEEAQESAPQPKPTEELFRENTSSLIPISKIKTNPNQPRKIFKQRELAELADSIRENGIIQPLIVVRVEDGFELVAGERRLRAAQRIGLEKVPVVFKNATDQDKIVMSIIENVQRSDLNCVEEGLAYYRLMEDFQLTQEEVAKRLGKERSSVANYLRILKLPRDVIDLIQKDLLSFGHAKVLVGLKDRDDIIALAHQVVEEGLSIRELEKRGKKDAPPKRRPRTPDNDNDAHHALRERLEQKTGFHFAISSGSNGAGKISIKFSDKEEFNSIYDFLLRP